jgi:metal-dependent amidase/aminoacylase/carboxypeptidase family protein
LAESIADAYRLRASVTLADGTPPLVNPADAAAWARSAVTRVLGPAAAVPLGTTNMGGEDFACYLEQMPGAFLRIGAREPGGERWAAHSPRFHAAEESIFVGAAVLAEAARIAAAA